MGDRRWLGQLVQVLYCSLFLRSRLIYPLNGRQWVSETVRKSCVYYNSRTVWTKFFKLGTLELTLGTNTKNYWFGVTLSKWVKVNLWLVISENLLTYNLHICHRETLASPSSPLILGDLELISQGQSLADDILNHLTYNLYIWHRGTGWQAL